jgi:hypothetical protein
MVLNLLLSQTPRFSYTLRFCSDWRYRADLGVLCWRAGLRQRRSDFPAVVDVAVSLVRFYVALSLALSSPAFSRGRDLRRAPKIKIVRFEHPAVLPRLRTQCLQAPAALKPPRKTRRRESDLVLFLQVARPAMAHQLVSQTQHVGKVGRRAGKSASIAPSLALSPCPPSSGASVRNPSTREGARRRAALPAQGPQGTVEPSWRVAALPRRVWTGRQ